MDTKNPVLTSSKQASFPRVSVVIPCYNHAKFLREAVESVICQTYENWECTIVNDGSLDNTNEVARAIINSFPKKRIFLIEKENSGVIDTRNLGLKHSSGQYILLLDADDKIHKNYLEEAVVILKEKLDIGFVYTDIQYFGCKEYEFSYGDFQSSKFLRSNQATVTSLFRREIYNQIGGFKKAMEEGLEDWEFWISAYEKGWQGYRLGKPYLYYRQHPVGSRLQNLTSNQLKLQVQWAKIISLHSQLYTSDEVLWADKALHQYETSSALFTQVESYQKAPTEPSTLANLRQGRRQIAELWLSLPTGQLANTYSGSLGKAHNDILSSGIRSQPLTNSEQVFVDEVKAYLNRGLDKSKSLQYLLAAMLYQRAEQIALLYDMTRIPQWLLHDYLKYTLDSPGFFQEVGEAENYYRYMHRWMDYLHTSISSNSISDIWSSIAIKFSQVANFISLYFNEYNLRDIYVKRAEILEETLKISGNEIDHDFRDRPVTRKKIRLGILAAHFNPSAETFASLPIYEYISREFEVILYSINRTGHPLEQYCQSCANSFKQLPQDLKDQVNAIRADDLDILFIATNVTAVTNQICLLSLHRLARVQVTSGGSVVTTGIRHVDYYISGQLTDPLPTAQHHYREKLVKLEGTAHCFSYGSEQEQATVKVERDSLGLSEKNVIFISGANFFKIIPELIDTWARIIAAVPNSVLVLLPFGPNWSNAYPKKTFLKHLSNKFSEYGVEADRLVVLDPQPVPNREDVKEYYKIADVYLDSYPFSATTSLIDPLEVGLPVIARQGTCFRSAMGAALLKSLDIPDLVADSEEAYIQLVIALGTNPELRQRQSEQIKQKMQATPPFLDSRAYSAKMGALFQNLFRKYLADSLSNNLRLRDINLIIFPDWSQSEELIAQNLANVIRGIATHPDKRHITLLVDTCNISEEDADLALSSVVMNLLMEEDLEVEEGPEISILGKISDMQWDALLTHLQAQIVLENENQGAIAQAKADKISAWELSSLREKRAVQQETGDWVLQAE